MRYYADESMFHGFIPRSMGTRFDLLLVDIGQEAAVRCWQDIADLLRHLELVFDRFNPDSEVSRVNSAARTDYAATSPELGEAIALCTDYFEKTEGLFDIASGDFYRVRVDNRHGVRFDKAGIALDFGGFAKGYALRRIVQKLRQAGIVSAFVDFGNSSIWGAGHHPHGSCWQVSLPDPVTGEPLETFDLKDRSLSTSGNTEHYTGHIVNPYTRRRNEDRTLCAVTAPDPLDAEIASTAWMIATEAQRQRIARNFEGLEGRAFAF